jgi:hypothetical protein
MSKDRDCRTCLHNSYIGVTSDWVSCGHPKTLAKVPRWEAGDPSFVNMLTGDIKIDLIDQMGDCPTWEASPTEGLHQANEQ